jgi:transcriptional regulator with XRE-family HTH domain
MELRVELKFRREALGWSQSELARRAGVRPSSVCLFEGGRRGLRWRTLELIRAAIEAGESGDEIHA